MTGVQDKRIEGLTSSRDALEVCDGECTVERNQNQKELESVATACTFSVFCVKVRPQAHSLSVANRQRLFPDLVLDQTVLILNPSAAQIS